LADRLYRREARRKRAILRRFSNLSFHLKTAARESRRGCGDGGKIQNDRDNSRVP